MKRIDEFKNTVSAMKESLSKILGADTDKFIQVACNYVEQNQSLLDKDRASLYKTINDAAQAGLYLDGQEAAPVPFKGKVKFMPMYKGLLKQVRNSGELASINCGVVYEEDVFEFFVDENGEHIKHVPDFKGAKAKPILTYCIARIKDGQPPYIEIMRESEIMDCKKSSRAGSDSPWNGPFANEMRKKTVLRRISKRLPSSTDLNATIHADDELFIPQDDDSNGEAEHQEKPATSSKLQDAVKPENDATGVETVIDNLSEQRVKKGGKKVMKYSTDIDGVEYITFDGKILSKLQSAKSEKSKVIIMYEEKTRASGKKYNEITDVVFDDISGVVSGESPI
jgi:recombination protein RecT